jgi:hypothetical protein
VTPSSWGGRRAQRLVAATLADKGTTCHLCGLEGADSADHDPPRSTLIASGVPNPDAPGYLLPAHYLPCNALRGARPITPALRAECRAARLAALGQLETAVPLSPRFADRRPVFPVPEPGWSDRLAGTGVCTDHPVGCD